MARKLIVALILCTLVIGVLPTVAQSGTRWTGADNLPTSPLDCPSSGGAAATAAAAAATTTAMATAEATAQAYDGGMAAGAPDKSGKAITLVDIPKLIGIGYFAATTKGEQEAATELGNVTVKTDGPTTADVNAQITFIQNYVTQGVDGILFSANDPNQIAPALKDALSKGIHVVGYDADSTPDAREWFVNQAQENGIAKAMMDSMEAEIGPNGSFAIVTSEFTAPNQSRWISEMQAYQAKCYPGMTWLETVESQEDQNQAFSQTQTLINKYGAKMDGVFGLSSVAFPGAADAVTQGGVCQGTASADDAVHVVGLSTPDQMKPFVTSGCVDSVVLWNPIDLGYAAVYVMRAVVDGTLKPGDTSVSAGRLGTLQVINGSQVLLGLPYVFNKDNIGQFDF